MKTPTVDKPTKIRVCPKCGRKRKAGEWIYLSSEKVQVRLSYADYLRDGRIIEEEFLCPRCRELKQ